MGHAPGDSQLLPFERRRERCLRRWLRDHEDQSHRGPSGHPRKRDTTSPADSTSNISEENEIRGTANETIFLAPTSVLTAPPRRQKAALIKPQGSFSSFQLCKNSQLGRFHQRAVGLATFFVDLVPFLLVVMHNRRIYQLG